MPKALARPMPEPITLSDGSTIPPGLVCEWCGARPVEVVVTAMSRADTDRLCNVDFAVLCGQVLQGLANDADTESAS